MTIKEAADKLYEKGVITEVECDSLKKEAGLGTFLKGIKPHIGTGIQTVAIGSLGLGALKEILSPLVMRAQAASSYKNLLSKVPSLEGKDPEQVKDYFKVIQTFSPKAATNPLVAGALVNKMMEFGGVDHKLVQDIAAIQAGTGKPGALDVMTGAAAKSAFGGGLPPSEITTDLGGVKAKVFYPSSL